MQAMLTPVDEPLIRALNLDAPSRIADIGCGGGRTTLEILRPGAGGKVRRGFDLSPAWIDLARGRARSDDRAIAFEIADVATATASEESYYRLVSRFGITFFDDPLSPLRTWPDGSRLADGSLSQSGAVRSKTRGWRAYAKWWPKSSTCRRPILKRLGYSVILRPPGTLLNRAGYGEFDVGDWRGVLPIGGGLPAAQAANFALASFSSFAELLA
jgi:SAM-dependent methyltransferase